MLGIGMGDHYVLSICKIKLFGQLLSNIDLVLGAEFTIVCQVKTDTGVEHGFADIRVQLRYLNKLPDHLFLVAKALIVIDDLGLLLFYFQLLQLLGCR